MGSAHEKAIIQGLNSHAKKQKECEESDKVYCYMDKLADMIDT